jgi:hypothetical protein
MRDILAALLRNAGYTHNDETDPYDLYWYSPKLGVRAMLVCIAHEMNLTKANSDNSSGFTTGYDTYDVSIAR